MSSKDKPPSGNNRTSQTPSPIQKRNTEPAASYSALSPSARQWAYERGSKSANTTANQIEADIQEVRNIIADYAIEPLEMLHLVDRWLQQLLGEFLQQRDRFKYQLSRSWENQELTNIKYDDNNDRVRKIYAAYRELEKARDVILSNESLAEISSYLGKTYDIKRDEMKEKFDTLIGHYFKILHCLECVDQETNSGVGDKAISDLKNKLTNLKKLNDKQSHTICIIGLEKAGKSTFINALLGFELLPAAADRCTQIRTVLKPPPENGDQQLFATITFYDDEEFRVFFNQMPKKTNENQQQLQQRKDQVLQAREILKTKFPEENLRLTGSNDIERQRRHIIKQLNDYITGEVYCNIIKQVAIYTDKLPGENYELLDVPGFDSPIREHRDAGLQAIKLADAFLFLTNGQQPSLTEPQISLLQEIQETHFEAMQRAFGIITKLDLCQTATICQDHYKKTYDELVDKRFKPEHIYAACPRIQIINQNSEEFRVIINKLRSFGDDLVQGFQRAKDGVNEFIEYELPKTHLKQLLEIGKMKLIRLVNQRLDKIKEKQLLPQNLGTISIDEYIKQQNAENWDEIYNKHIFQPAFEQANHWHTTVVTKERAKFIDDTKQKFHDSFFELTADFTQRQYPIEKLLFQKYGASKLQLNPHLIDADIREKLTMELEEIVDKTSDILAAHLYQKYVCELENILNNICPQINDLYRTKLTLEKCTNETHALVMRVCRPVIMATVRYSYIDSNVKQDAITELIYIAPTVAYNILNNPNKDNVGEIFASQIEAAASTLANRSDMTTSIITILFNK